MNRNNGRNCIFWNVVSCQAAINNNYMFYIIYINKCV